MRPLAWLILPAILLSSCGDDEGYAFIARGPQVALVTSTTALVAWKSVLPVVGAVEYGETLAFESRTTPAGSFADHAHVLFGLQPDTRYFYRTVQDGEVTSSTREFRTASLSTSLRFAVLGDSGTGGSEQRDVAERIRAFAPDLVLHTGDVIYDSGAEHELDPTYFVPYADLIDRIPFYLSLGNHDVVTDGGQPLLGAVHLPTNSADGSERFYSFDRGGVHFVALDSNAPLGAGSVQRNWLDADLAAASANWIFVFFHHPPYSSSLHGSDLALRASLAPLFEQHGVDVVFTGHDHDYERTFPMVAEAPVETGEDPDYSDPAGPVYLVTGGGGRSLYAAGTSAFTAYSESTFHHVEVELSGTLATFTGVRRNATVLDRFTITKGP